MRSEWKFSYAITNLFNAATAKRDHHKSRFDWWTSKRGEVMDQIKEDGLQVSESLVSQYSKTGYAVSEAEVKIDPKFQKQLDECVSKMKHHKSKVDSYQVYVEVLGSRPGGDSLELNVDDWTFFFGG